jgi:acyl-CoA synthetase (AMP-forming)/AMP-acid ligase II
MLVAAVGNEDVCYMGFRSHPSAPASSLVEILRHWSDAIPDAQAFLFLPDGEVEGPRCTYADLDRMARALAVVLRERAEPGDRALLLYEPGLDFLTAFFACWYAGLIPVPACPARRRARNGQFLESIAKDCQPRLGLTTAPLAANQAAAVNLPLQWLATDQIDDSHAGRWREPRMERDAIALLQYTSGSTAAPKGVMVTHANLLHNESLIARALAHPTPGCGICWLPHYHDMGLVGFLLQTVFRGARTVLFPPGVVAQRPFLWLQAVARYRAHISGGPNFAYNLCVQRIAAEQRSALDLRDWTIAVVGSEPVSVRTMEGFTEAFMPCGFRPEAFYPCYGLAEATLFVTGGATASPPVTQSVHADALEEGHVVPTLPGAAGPRTLVGCGWPWGGQDVVIVDPHDRTRCPADRVGEIWVHGPSVAKGYWNRPEEAAQTFAARLADGGSTKEEGGRRKEEMPVANSSDSSFLLPPSSFLRTGDLGFVQGGELFVTGRLKDLLVIHGRNHYPQDIEATVQGVHPALREGGGAAFETGPDGEPRLVLVQELDRHLGRHVDLAQLARAVRQAVAAQHELRVHDLWFLEPGALPRTSSGKVRRHACRTGYEAGTLRLWKER